MQSSTTACNIFLCMHLIYVLLQANTHALACLSVYRCVYILRSLSLSLSPVCHRFPKFYGSGSQNSVEVDAWWELASTLPNPTSGNKIVRKLFNEIFELLLLSLVLLLLLLLFFNDTAISWRFLHSFPVKKGSSCTHTHTQSSKNLNSPNYPHELPIYEMTIDKAK